MIANQFSVAELYNANKTNIPVSSRYNSDILSPNVLVEGSNKSTVLSHC